MPIPAKLKNLLAKAKIKHDVVPHRTVFTVYDLSQTLKIKTNAIVKTLLIKADRDYHLVLLAANRRLNLDALKKTLGAKKVSMASEKEMTNQFKVKPGAMTPFGSLHKVHVVVDRGLAKTTSMLFGAGSFTESLQMKMKDYLKHEDPQIAPISEAAPAFKPNPKPKRKKIGMPR